MKNPMNTAICVIAALLIAPFALAEVNTVQGEFHRQQVLWQGGHQIYVLEGTPMDLEVTSIDADSKIVRLTVNGQPKTLDFGRNPSLQIDDTQRRISILADASMLDRETPLLNFAFKKLYTGLPPTTEKLELASYPQGFGADSEFVLVVGERAETDKIVSGIKLLQQLKISTEIEQFFDNSTKTYVPMPIIPLGRAALDNMVQVGTGNYLVVGGPCANTIAAELLGNPANCEAGFAAGKATIQLFEQNGHYALLVAGYSAYDTERAVVFLKDAKDLPSNRIVIDTKTLAIVEQ